jgi:hypothetical protein
MLDVQVKTEGLSETTRAVLGLPGVFDRARASALKSLGYAVRQDLKQEGRALEPKLNPHTGVLAVTHDTAKRHGRNVRWGKKRIKGTNTWQTGTSRSRGRDGGVAQKRSTRQNPFARFVNMIRYTVDTEDNLVEIGVLKPKPIYYTWFRRNVEGFGTPVTPRMRKFLFATGFPIRKETTSLRTPARPWIGKVGESWREKATPYFEQKFWLAVNRYRTGGSKA